MVCTHLIIDIATTALGLAKIVIQVGPSRVKKHTRGNPHQILHDRLIGVKSESKRFIFGEIAISSIPVLPKFEARHLSNLIYAYGLAECISKMDEGRILPCTQAMSKLRHFNPQDLSNMLWAYAKVGASNPALFKASGDSIVALNNLRDFWPQALSNIVWAYATGRRRGPTTFATRSAPSMASGGGSSSAACRCRSA